MGVHQNIDHYKFPRQGKYLHKRVEVTFNFDSEKMILGTVVRNDAEDPHRTIISLDDGRVVEATECQYSLPVGTTH